MSQRCLSTKNMFFLKILKFVQSFVESKVSLADGIFKQVQQQVPLVVVAAAAAGLGKLADSTAVQQAAGAVPATVLILGLSRRPALLLHLPALRPRVAPSVPSLCHLRRANVFQVFL